MTRKNQAAKRAPQNNDNMFNGVFDGGQNGGILNDDQDNLGNMPLNDIGKFSLGDESVKGAKKGGRASDNGIENNFVSEPESHLDGQMINKIKPTTFFSSFFWVSLSIVTLGFEFVFAGSSVFSSFFYYLTESDYDSPFFKMLPFIQEIPVIREYRASSVEALVMTLLFLLLSHVCCTLIIHHYSKIKYLTKEEEANNSESFYLLVPIVIASGFTAFFNKVYYDALVMQLGAETLGDDMFIGGISPSPFLVVIFTISFVSSYCLFRAFKAIFPNYKL